MHEEISRLAFHGSWQLLLSVLQKNPGLVNSAKEPKGYTSLHQAAWHGASIAVIGQLLALGADPTTRTVSKQQTAREIAREKHPDREDLQFVLAETAKSLSRLIRKVVAETPDLFEAYDGNQLVFDRLIETLGFDSYLKTNEEVDVRFASIFKVITGLDLSSIASIKLEPVEDFAIQVDTEFWASRFLPLLRDAACRHVTSPLEKHWAVISDLFDPAPSQWGLRGDLFLWIEMRQALCHVPIPEDQEALVRVISGAFETLVGVRIDFHEPVYIARFARGGMSSGMVSPEFWRRSFIPLMQRRTGWIEESWHPLCL